MKTLCFLLLFSSVVLGNFADNVTIDNETVTLSGNFSTITFKNRGVLIVDGDMNLNGININGQGKVIVKPGVKLTINSSLNLNGGDTVEVYGTLKCKAIELQNGTNFLNNQGIIDGEELQINSDGSLVKNCGILTISNYTNFHKGKYESCCGKLVTRGLNVNGPKIAYGTGSIRVTDNLNLNQLLTESALSFCYPGTINKDDNLGAAIRTTICEGCTPLPIRFGNITVTKEGEYYVMSLPVVSISSNNQYAAIRYSVGDMQSWKTAVVIFPKDVQAGKTYIAKFKINQK